MADLVGVQVVRVGGVDEGDAGVEGGVDGLDRALAVGASLDRHGHAAQADRGDLDVGDPTGLHPVGAFRVVMEQERGSVGYQA